jgi:hypothetical protein
VYSTPKRSLAEKAMLSFLVLKYEQDSQINGTKKANTIMNALRGKSTAPISRMPGAHRLVETTWVF